MGATNRRWLDLASAAGIGLLAFLLTGVAVQDGRVAFQLGPNDHGYLEGFAPHYEVENGAVGWRWTTYHARIDLPILLEGPSEVLYRFSRVFGETAEAEVTLGGSTIDRFTARGGAVETRRVRLPALSPTPLSFGIEVDSHERRNLGLKLDWIAVEAGREARLRLDGATRIRIAVLAAFLLALFRFGGLGLAAALPAGLAFVAAAAATAHRDLFGLAHATAQLGLPLSGLSIAVALYLRRRPKGSLVLPLFVASYLLRGYGLFHPETFYGDVANARDYVEVFRETSGSLAERGVETQKRTNVGYPRRVGGKDYAFPYSPLYFLPFGLARTAGGIEDAVRHAGLAASALSTIPIFWIGSAAFSATAGVFASLLWMVSPPVFSRLLLALHAAVIGNLLDTLAIACVLALSFEPRSLRRLGAVFAATLASLLVYTSSLFSMGAFFLCASLLERRLAAKLLGVVTIAGSLTVTWLYWPFLVAFVREILPALASGTPGPAADSAPDPVGSALSRIPLFYGVLYPPLAVAGLYLARRKGDVRAFRVLAAWSLAFVLMVSLRAFGGGVFKDIKEIEFAAPLVAILTGGALAALGVRGGKGKLAAAALTAALVLFGLARYRSYLEAYASPLTSIPEMEGASGRLQEELEPRSLPRRVFRVPQDAGEGDSYEPVRFPLRLGKEMDRRLRSRLLEGPFLLRSQESEEEDASVVELVRLERAQVSIVEERKIVLDG
jgi:hypothetical protein